MCVLIGCVIVIHEATTPHNCILASLHCKRKRKLLFLLYMVRGINELKNELKSLILTCYKSSVMFSRDYGRGLSYFQSTQVQCIILTSDAPSNVYHKSRGIRYTNLLISILVLVVSEHVVLDEIIYLSIPPLKSPEYIT